MVAFLTFLASPLGKLAGYGLIALVLIGTTLGVKHEWDLGQVARQQVVTIARASKAATRAVAVVDKAASSADSAEQTHIVLRTRTLIEKVPTYVTVRTPCVAWGLVRLHDAAVLGVDPSTLQAPAGAADDTCSDVSPAALMAGVVANYGAAQANAKQLDDLEADLNGRAEAVPATAP